MVCLYAYIVRMGEMWRAESRQVKILRKRKSILYLYKKIILRKNIGSKSICVMTWPFYRKSVGDGKARHLTISTKEKERERETSLCLSYDLLRLNTPSALLELHPSCVLLDSVCHTDLVFKLKELFEVSYYAWDAVTRGSHPHEIQPWTIFSSTKPNGTEET